MHDPQPLLWHTTKSFEIVWGNLVEWPSISIPIPTPTLLWAKSDFTLLGPYYSHACLQNQSKPSRILMRASRCGRFAYRFTIELSIVYATVFQVQLNNEQTIGQRRQLDTVT
jgi:hypothetical protein